jgi:alpha-tubulin suppressor-like RCC1 family protein
MSLWCWGENGDGELGVGDKESRYVPVQVGLEAWSYVATGHDHTCGIHSGARSLWCWGSNAYDQLGVDVVIDVTTPQLVDDSWQWDMVACGRYHICAIRTDGSLWCWGANEEGQLGLGDTEPRATLTQVGTQFQSVFTAYTYTCGIKEDGTAWCWGNNDYGQLGLGDTDPRLSPTQVCFD